MSAVPSTQTPIAAVVSSLSGVNVLLMGPAGTGKTHALGNFADEITKAGGEFFALFLESGAESFFGYWRDRGLEIPEGVHWHVLKQPQADFLTMMEDAKKINMMSLDALAKMVDPNRSKHNQFIELLTALNDFPCDRTGKKYGAVNTWGPNRALGVDGMAGLGRAAMANVIGGKAVKSQSDWGIAQDQVEKLVRMLCDNCACHFVLLAHVERETDQVLGGTKLMVSTLGRALAPKIPALFSDVILAVREGTKFSWDTANVMADLKTRNIPIASQQPPGFGPILAKWKSRGGVL